MKLLLLSDEESPLLWDCFPRDLLSGVDLILSAGDLEAEYLSFLVTLLNRPLVYVPGNHDGGYRDHPPEGCLCADDTIVTAAGLRVAGLGGCRRYNGGPYQYTERQMAARAAKLRLRAAVTGGYDILLTHAPARGVGDIENDRVHGGFEAFLPLLEKNPPRLMVHGHVHKRYAHDFRRVRDHNGVTVLNACGWYLYDI